MRAQRRLDMHGGGGHEFDSHLGLQIGPYRLLRQVDINPDHSRVFLARSEEHDGWLRLTVFDPMVATDALRRGLGDRLEQTAQLEHPSLLAIRSVEVIDDLLVVTNDWPEAWTLRDVLDTYVQRSGHMPGPLLGAVGNQLHDLLRYLTTAQSHAGLALEATSGNLSLDSVGLTVDGRVLHLAAAHVSLNEIGTLLPPPEHPRVLAHLAPEQLRSYRPTERGDIYSLGMLLLSLVMGRNPMEHPTIEATRSAVQDGIDPDALTVWKPRLATVMRHALAPSPERRDLNLGHIHSALDRARVSYGDELHRAEIASLLHELYGPHARPTLPAEPAGDREFLRRLAEHLHSAVRAAPAWNREAVQPAAAPAAAAPANTHGSGRQDRRFSSATILAAAALLVSVLVAGTVIGTVIGRPGSTPAATSTAASAVLAPQTRAPQAPSPTAQPVAQTATTTTTQRDALATAQAKARSSEAQANEADARARKAEAKARRAEASARAAVTRAIAGAGAGAATTAAGATAQGATAQGATAQGATAQGATAQGATAQGATAQGATATIPSLASDAGAAKTAAETADSRPQAGPPAPIYDRSVTSAVPVSYDARSPQDVARALAGVEAYARRAGVPSSVASGSTSALTAHMVGDYVPGDSLTVHPRAALGWIIDAAEAGKSASSIRSGLLRAHVTGQL